MGKFIAALGCLADQILAEDRRNALKALPNAVERCPAMKDGLRRCVLPKGHGQEHLFRIPRPERTVHLRVKRRIALTILSLAEAERRKRLREQEKSRARGWRPEPGKSDVNAVRAADMEDLMAELRSKLGEGRSER